MALRGITTLYGKLNSLDDGFAYLTLLTGEALTAVCPPELTGQLAQRLGTVIGVSGMAEYRVDDLALVAFAITELTPYREVPITEAFASLAEIVAPYYAWAKTPQDIDDYVKWVRGTEDEAINERFDGMFDA